MAHFPKPFFRSARNSWFVQIADKQIKLGDDKDAAYQRYHELTRLFHDDASGSSVLPLA